MVKHIITMTIITPGDPKTETEPEPEPTIEKVELVYGQTVADLLQKISNAPASAATKSWLVNIDDKVLPDTMPLRGDATFTRRYSTL